MSTRIGFFIVIGLLVGGLAFQLLFRSPGWGVIAGTFAGLALGYWLDRRANRSA